MWKLFLEKILHRVFSLLNFVPNLITSDQENYDYHFIAADGHENDDANNLYSWENIQNGFWLTEKQKAIFLNEAHETIYKSVKVLEKIELLPKS